MAAIWLTSTGLSFVHIRNHFIDHVKAPRGKKVSIIYNACRDGKENKYAQLALEQFLNLGFSNVTLRNVLVDNLSEIFNSQIVYICGGNTFKLMSDLHEAKAIPYIQDFVAREENMLIGVSAGAIILGESLETSFDENLVGLKSYDGLKLLPFSLIVHFDNSRESKFHQFSKHRKVKTLSNNQAIFIDSTQELLING